MTQLAGLKSVCNGQLRSFLSIVHVLKSMSRLWARALRIPTGGGKEEALNAAVACAGAARVREKRPRLEAEQ